MDLMQNAIFDLAEQRLRWLDDREVLLSQNMANLDTPGFVPKDQPDFAASLSRSSEGLARTDPRHLVGTQLPAAELQQKAVHSPDGNAVTLEDQLTKVADTESAQKLTTAIYREYLNMFSLALGHTSG